MNLSLKFNSKFFLFLTAVWLLFQFFGTQLWVMKERVWPNEAQSYYGYLPALVVENDITLKSVDMNPDSADWHRYYYPRKEANGYVFKTTMGVAMLQAPFFFVAHGIALNGGNPEDGFSEVYMQLSLLSAIFYCFLGLVFIRKTLLYFFSDVATTLTLLAFVAGTNLYFYSMCEATMSHVYSFFLVSVFVFLTVSWHRNPSGKKLLLTGFILGLIMLIRPVNLCLALFFLLYKDATQKTLTAKFKLLFSQWKYIIGAGILFFAVLFPQLLYWKIVSGDWLYYSYGPNEKFFWTKPKIWLGLFSYQKGWLVWTPIMWFAVIGILLLYKKTERKFILPVVISLTVYIYIIFCWWCWWYGGGYGMRPMVDVMAILAIPFAAFLSAALRSKLIAYPVIAIGLFLIGLNLFQTSQNFYGQFHWDGTSEKVYWKLFLNTHPKEDYSPYLESPNIEEAQRGETGLKK